MSEWDLGQRRLYLCTPNRPDLEVFLTDCIEGGVDIVQLRDKNLAARILLERAAVALAVCHKHGVPFILNDRPDLALEAGADGVHVGQDDAPVALARRILGPNAIVGLSTHEVRDLQAAHTLDVDYISAGPVTETPTKPGRPGTGIPYAAHASAVATTPTFVTGGVTPATVPVLAAAGIRHFVVVRWLTEAEDAGIAARKLRTVIDGALLDQKM